MSLANPAQLVATVAISTAKACVVVRVVRKRMHASCHDKNANKSAFGDFAMWMADCWSLLKL